MHQHGFTIKGNGILRVLQSAVGVSFPFTGDPKIQKELSIKSYTGTWDTGATGTVITKKVVAELGLKPTGQVTVHTASGSGEVNTYLVNIYLPMNVTVQTVRVTEGVLKDMDVLIGMDIITLGDFSISHVGGKTVMSFGMPSCEVVDYVEKINTRKNSS